jgi:hypothetical protein
MRLIPRRSASWLAGVLSTPAYANTVVPNFTRGTINATTETTTKIVEVIRQS